MTSGRSVWWRIDIEHTLDEPFINQLFGSGFHFIRYVNKTFYGQNIWAHNDYIMLFGTNGWVGLILYLYTYFRVSNFLIRENNNKVLKYGFHAINILNATLNMLYTYFCATLAVPFMLIAMFEESDNLNPDYYFEIED